MRSLGLEEIELEPTLEELDIPARPVSGRRSRALPLVLGGLGAVVGWGFMGGTTDPAPRSAEGAAGVEAPSAMVPSVAVPAVTITLPSGNRLSPPRVRVAGTTGGHDQPILITVALGQLLLGEAVVRPVGGSFEADVPVLAPRRSGPLPVDVRVALAARPSVVLSELHARLDAAPVVSIDEVTAVVEDGVATIDVRGTSTVELGPVSVALIHGDRRTSLEAIVGPVRDLHLAPAAHVFGIGAWGATFSGPGLDGAGRIVVTWNDGTVAGGSASADIAPGLKGSLRGDARLRGGGMLPSTGVGRE